MSKQMEKIVMMDSDEAAHIQTVTGWVDRHGRFWGNDEYQARWCGSTHRKCKNKPDVHPVHSTRGYCEECHREARQAKFLAMERVVWSGEPLTIFDSDKYFFDAESLADYCVENSLLPSELQLVICEPNYPPEFDIEQHCEEIIPEGGDYFSLPQTVRDAADALNKAIKESEPVSWSGSERSAIVSDDILTDEQGGACSMSQVDKQELRKAELENDELRQKLANAEHQLYMAELAKHNLRASCKAQFRKRRAAEKRIAGLEDDVRNIIELLDASEWAEHCTHTVLGRRLEVEVTRLIGTRRVDTCCAAGASKGE